MPHEKHPEHPITPEAESARELPASTNKCTCGYWRAARLSHAADCPAASPPLPSSGDLVEREKILAERLANDLERLCCAETEGKFFDYVTDSVGEIVATLRSVAAIQDGANAIIKALKDEFAAREAQLKAEIISANIGYHSEAAAAAEYEARLATATKALEEGYNYILDFGDALHAAHTIRSLREALHSLTDGAKP